MYKTPPPHGTPARYRQHIRNHGTPCQACKDAHSLRERLNRAKRTNRPTCEHGYTNPHQNPPCPGGN